MQKLLFAFVSLLIAAPAVMAQDERRGEIFVGYSNLQGEGITDRDDPTSPFDNDFFGRRKGLHGVQVSGAGFLSSVFGIKGDVSWHRNRDTRDLVGGGQNRIDTDVVYFMAGPTLRVGKGPIQPFVHAMAGGAHTRYDIEASRAIVGGTISSNFDVGSTDFAAAIGGGIDIKIGNRLRLRAIQVDYAPIFLRDRSISVLGGAGAITPFTLEGQRQDNIRISVGLVF